jgi:hypothetical protein
MDKKKNKSVQYILLAITIIVFTLIFRNWDAIKEFIFG